MTAGDGKPCVRCGTSEWNSKRDCKECKRRRARQWWKNNTDKSAEYCRRYQQANPDKNADNSRRWARANRDKANAMEHQYRARKTQAGGSYTAAEFKEMCDHYGNKCLRCGRNDVKLTFDHVIPVSKGGTSDISNGQPLCRSCNSAKKDRHIDYRPDVGIARWIRAKLFG